MGEWWEPPNSLYTQNVHKSSSNLFLSGLVPLHTSRWLFNRSQVGSGAVEKWHWYPFHPTSAFRWCYSNDSRTRFRIAIFTLYASTMAPNNCARSFFSKQKIHIWASRSCSAIFRPFNFHHFPDIFTIDFVLRFEPRDIFLWNWSDRSDRFGGHSANTPERPMSEKKRKLCCDVQKKRWLNKSRMVRWDF